MSMGPISNTLITQAGQKIDSPTIAPTQAPNPIERSGAGLTTAATHALTTKTATKEAAIQKFHNEVIKKYNLVKFSPMPIDMVLKPLGQYCAEQIDGFVNDFEQLRKQIDAASSDKRAIVTAGSPGSGKSMHCEALIKKENMAWLDFDKVALPGLTEFQQARKTSQKAEENYNKYRGASQAMHNCLLPYALSQGKNFALSITGTTDFFESNLSFFADKEYEVEVHHITCPNSVRVASNDLRNDAGHFQCTSEDLVSKGEAFYQKTQDYLQLPNIEFWYRGAADAAPTLAAAIVGGKKKIHDPAALADLIGTHQQENEKSGQLLADFFKSAQNVQS